MTIYVWIEIPYPYEEKKRNPSYPLVGWRKGKLEIYSSMSTGQIGLANSSLKSQDFSQI